ncbi:hypothetical protein JHK84_043238 [Glycine max]|nr:hypothetical protein JHK86_043047 [Glycine max]KAG5117125.1 hypothetical protein JHK84_043238 [Glycine max]
MISSPPARSCCSGSNLIQRIGWVSESRVRGHKGRVRDAVPVREGKDYVDTVEYKALLQTLKENDSEGWREVNATSSNSNGASSSSELKDNYHHC